jgi:2-keto-3-deoxy-L-rhamnonate aldolase RhmA
MTIDSQTFRQRLRANDRLAGTFVKTPTGHATEILGDVGFDFVIIDEEHAPFDRAAIDQALVASRAAGITALVRIATGTAPNILSVLDGGATGVVVPHVASVAKARDVVESCRYGGGKRGFSNSPRAGGYGRRALQDHIAHADAITTIVAQIEDPDALDHLDAIAGVEGIDALFIGRGDLAVAMGEPSPEAPAVFEAARHVCVAAHKAGKPVMVFVNSQADAAAMKTIGANVFVYASDQGLMRRAAIDALTALKTI